MQVKPGCEPIDVEAGEREDGRRIGVLLSHGFTGSPASMRPWAEDLAARGYAVSAPRLPGHGTTWQDMAGTTYADWYAAVEAAYEALAASCDRVVVGGLSMGGGLALWLAANHPEVAGVALVNPAVASTNKQLLAVPVAKRVLKSMPGIGNDIKKPGGDELGYDRVPLQALSTMLTGWKQVRADLFKVTAPVLLFRSAQDHVVDPSSARIILDSISSTDKQERLLTESYHVATLDHDAPVIFEESAAFIDRVTAT